MFGKYSLQNVMKVYNKNRPLITAYINGQSIEGLNDDSQKSSEIASYGGLSMFIAIVLLHCFLFFWAIYAIIYHWNHLPTWVKFASIVLLFFGGSVFSLLLVYLTINENKKSESEFEMYSINPFSRRNTIDGYYE
jgi:hypothetical protein